MRALLMLAKWYYWLYVGKLCMGIYVLGERMVMWYDNHSTKVKRLGGPRFADDKSSVEKTEWQK